MKALFGMAEAVPMSRVLSDYRAWLIALVLGLVGSVAALILVVLPLFASADAASARATRANETLAAARAELQASEQTRDGSAQAAKVLEKSKARKGVLVAVTGIVDGDEIGVSSIAEVGEEK